MDRAVTVELSYLSDRELGVTITVHYDNSKFTTDPRAAFWWLAGYEPTSIEWVYPEGT